LKEGQSLEEFIAEVEKKVDDLVGESTLNEYKSFKALVKHKRRMNRVFCELSAETALHSLPPSVDKKIPAVVVAVCSAGPPKAPRRKSSRREREKAMQVIFLLLSFVLRKLNLWSLVRGNEKLRKMFLMVKFRQLRVLLSWARRKLRRL
jgi:hypothetical protein